MSAGTSSRHVPAATVFCGPIKRWKKQWVIVSGSLHFNGGSNILLLRRWTPHATESSKSSGEEEEPPKRKIREQRGSRSPGRGFRLGYVGFILFLWVWLSLIVVLEEEKREAAESADGKAKTRNEHSFTTAVKNDGACWKPNNGVCIEAVQAK
ncbi:hypothetical protein NMG60_11037320 [Bertholletia excelsa]